MGNILQNKQHMGWLQGLLSVFVFLGLNQVVGRYATVILEVNPIVFSCAAFTSSSFILLGIGGFGALSRETIRSVDTWTYGVVLMMSYITGMILYGYITSTELTMLQKVSVALSLLGSWFFMGRNPDRYQIIGTIIVTIGVIIVAADVEGKDKGIVYFLAGIYGLAQVARVFVAELHRPHAKAASMSASDPKARARVIGFVMLVVSTLFLTLFALIALAQENAGEPFVKNFPMLSDFTHPASIIAGMCVGVLLIAPLRMLEFSSSQLIKAENFMIILTFMTVSTLFWEWITAPLTGLSIKAISDNDILAACFITSGGLLIALTRTRKKKPEWQNYLRYEGQDLEQVEDSREIVANTLEHFEGDMEKSANALELPVQVIKALFMDKDKVLAFKDDVLKEVARKYRRNVALSDALTGLSNRAGFMTALKGAAYEADVFSVIFIDLDKFKPVNDTYGHDAGDFVLKGVAERLGEMFPKRALATRLGGDEFCVLLLDKNKAEAEKLVPQIQEAVAQPFKFEGNTFAVSASMGIASFPEDSENAEELLKLADSGMYSEKKER